MIPPLFGKYTSQAIRPDPTLFGKMKNLTDGRAARNMDRLNRSQREVDDTNVLNKQHQPAPPAAGHADIIFDSGVAHINLAGIQQLHLHFDGGNTAELRAHLAQIEASLSTLTHQGVTIMTALTDAVAQVKATRVNIADMHDLFSQWQDLLVQKDAINQAQQAQILELIANAAIDDAAKLELTTAATESFQASTDEENRIRLAIQGVPPVGVTPLPTSFADKAAFDAGVAAYTGPEAVTYATVAAGEVEVKGGTQPALAYFQHSVDGTESGVDTTGPAD